MFLGLESNNQEHIVLGLSIWLLACQFFCMSLLKIQPCLWLMTSTRCIYTLHAGTFTWCQQWLPFGLDRGGTACNMVFYKHIFAGDGGLGSAAFSLIIYNIWVHIYKAWETSFKLRMNNLDVFFLTCYLEENKWTFCCSCYISTCIFFLISVIINLNSVSLKYIVFLTGSRYFYFRERSFDL